MAILDRPLFQRRLTKDQLRAYGIPAFANGGVVQRFDNGGDVNKPPFLANRTDTAIDPEILFKNKNLPPVGTVIREEIVLDEETGEKIKITETVVQGPKGMKVVQTKKEVVFRPEKKVKTPRGEKIIPATGEDQETGDVRPEGTTTPGSGYQAGASTVEEQENDRDPLGAEKDKLSELEALVRERSDLYKKILGDPKEGLKQQGLLQLAQFGLNLASARGGTFAEKIAKSAKDPLQTFAALGREAIKDERAIDMLAIKGAEDEMARTQKVGNFGQLVQDYVNEGFSREKALEKAEKVFAQKTGKTVAELKNEAFKEYLRFYEAELGAGDEARNKANKAIEQDFGTPMFTPDEPEVKRAE